jgi:uncharacterized repeat protein (TIGR01451 family)
MTRLRGGVRLLLGTAVLVLAQVSLSAAQTVSLTAIGTAYTQDFDTLASTGTSSAVPAGWAFVETGTAANTTYTAGTGSSTTGDTYSFGAAGSAERAFGALRSGALSPLRGAGFTNNTGGAIQALQISYAGEQWRLGFSPRPAPDRLDFQYSTTATNISTGTYADVNDLDFSSPITTGTIGALNGNLAPNRTIISFTITGLNIPNGSTFFIRWVDFDIPNSDDGMAVDDFSLTPLQSNNPTGVGAANPASLPAGSSTLLTVAVTPGTNPPSTGLAVSGNLTAIGGSGTQAFFDNGTNGDVTPNDLTFSYLAVVAPFTPAGPKSLPFTITDAQERTGSGPPIALVVEPPTVAIHDIQGSGSSSAYAGQAVKTSGIVTGVKSNGFFIQTPDAQVDGNPLTSEGIAVFTSSAPPAPAVVGNLVSVIGTVSEFIPGADPNSPPLTELGAPLTISVLATGQTLPAAITLTAADTSPTGSIEQLEKFEGMRVHVDSLNVVAPTQGTINETNATSATNGVFYGVIAEPRPFREPGVEVPDPLPPGSPCCVPRFDANPERLRVDSDAIGAPALEVTSGATVTNLTGPLDYSFRTYTILPEPASPPAASGNAAVAPVPVPATYQFTVASYNVERFFDTVNDPNTSDAVLTPLAFANRLNKLSLAVRNILRAPDIVGLEEVENLTTLQAIADKISADAVLAGQPDPAYQAFLEEGNDIGGIDVGFLVKSADGRVEVVDVTQEGKDTTYINPNNGQPELLNDRPSLVLRAIVHPPSGTVFPVTVIVNHLRSLSGVDDPADGNRVRTKRRAQAEFLANLIQARQLADPDEHIVSVGDYNAFQFNDGYVDSIGTISGTPTPASQVVLASIDLVDPDLVETMQYAPEGQRYSYTFDGNAQELDHVLITQNLVPRIATLSYGRLDADFPESVRNDANQPGRISDHDPVVAYFNFLHADLAVTKTAPTSVSTGSSLAYTIGVVNGMADAAEDVILTDPLPAGTTFQSLTAPAGWSCSAPAPGGTGTVNCAKSSVAPQASDTFTLVVDVDCELPNGTNIVNTATVTSATLDPDPTNNSRTATVMVANPAPTISNVSASPASLWPPNHKMRNVTVAYDVADNCGPSVCALSVSSDEPENGIGDGDTAPDFEVQDEHHVRLRAERAGMLDGRVYTIGITCTDSAGNAATETVAVEVPLHP